MSGMREDTSSVSKRSTKCGGFTLIEAVASIALVGVGLVAAMQGFSSMSRTDYVLRQKEIVQRLAVDKYDELISTGGIDTADLSGDFTDRNINDYEWSAEVTPSGEENLQIVTVTVKKSGSDGGPEAVVDGLIFEPPISTGGTQ